MAARPPSPTPLGPRVATPLHESLLYAAQARFYADGGGAVFAGDAAAIPSYITTNPFVAHTLATAILHAWRDLREVGALAATGPLRVLELGAGTGRLGLSVLRELLARCRAARVDPRRVVYVMTDGNERSVREWAANPALAPLLAAGNLQLGVLDLGMGPESADGGAPATADATAGRGQRAPAGPRDADAPARGPYIRLIAPVDGAVLGPADFGCESARPTTATATAAAAAAGGSPTVVLGTYLFDSLHMDVLRVDYTTRAHAGDAGRSDSAPAAAAGGVDIGGGVVASLQRGLLTVRTDDPALAADPSHPRLLRRMHTEWAYEPFDPTHESSGPYASDAHLRAVASWYAAHAHEAGDCVDDGYRSALLEEGGDGGSDAAEEDSASSTGSVGGDPPPLPLQATVTLPLGAFHCLRLLRRLTVGDDHSGGEAGEPRGPGFLLLTIDKGVGNPATFVGAGPPDIHLHGGGSGSHAADTANADDDGHGGGAAFSLMVNFHALELYVRALGGDALVTPHDDVNVKTAVLAVLPRPPTADGSGSDGGSAFLSLAADLPLLHDTFTHGVAVFGPSEWFDLHRAATTPAVAAAHDGGNPRLGRRRPATEAAAAAAYTYSDSDDATVPASLAADVDDADEGGDDAASAASPLFVTSDTDGEGEHSSSDSDSDGPLPVPCSSHRHRRRRRPYRAAHRTVERAHYADGSTGNVGPLSDATGRLTFPPADTDAGGNRTGEDDAALAARAAAERREARRRRAAAATPGAPSALPLTTVRGVTALLRLSRWDPDLLPHYRDLLGRRLRYLTPPRRAALLDGLHA
jgi:hypothetical protein